MNEELISVIMPAYNAGLFIQQSIDSVLAQTYKQWELLIVDDGSTDNTAEVVKQNCLADARIKYIYQPNGKQGKARNNGIGEAHGEYIAFLDADDLWLPGKLEQQIAEIKSGAYDLVFSDSYFFYDSQSLNLTERMHTLTGVFQGRDAVELFLAINRIPILTVLAKKSKILAVNGFTEKEQIQCAEDYHLWLQLLLQDNVFYGSGTVTAAYRLHANAATGSDKLASRQIPEMLYDLWQQYPAAAPLLKANIKNRFRQLYATGVYTKPDVLQAIKENCRVLDAEQYVLLLKLVNTFLGTRFSKRLINFLVNG